jgi:hypothetical protein
LLSNVLVEATSDAPQNYGTEKVLFMDGLIRNLVHKCKTEFQDFFHVNFSKNKSKHEILRKKPKKGYFRNPISSWDF